jgi:hypothetical protein
MGSPLTHFVDGRFIPAEVADQIVDISGVAADDIYAVGFESHPYNSHLFHFDGSAWTRMADLGTPASAVFARSSGDVFVGTAEGLWHSVNGGSSLTLLEATRGCSVASISGSADEISAIGDCSLTTVKVFLSSDGGHTFTVSGPIADLTTGLSISTRDGSTFVSGYTSQTPAQQRILRTNDGLSYADITPPQAIQPATTVGIWAVTAAEVWAGDYSKGHGIAHSTDAGATWALDLATSEGVAGIFADAKNVYAVGPFVGLLHGK